MKAIEIILSKGISAHPYEEEGKLCGYELDTYTAAGLNQIIFLDFRDSELSPTEDRDIAEVFQTYIKSIDIDDEIEHNRQCPKYKALLTLREAVDDIEEWRDEMELIANEIKEQFGATTNL